MIVFLCWIEFLYCWHNIGTFLCWIEFIYCWHNIVQRWYIGKCMKTLSPSLTLYFLSHVFWKFHIEFFLINHITKWNQPWQNYYWNAPKQFMWCFSIWRFNMAPKVNIVFELLKLQISSQKPHVYEFVTY